MTPRILFRDKPYACRDAETVLDRLERSGIVVPASCRSGVCQSCIMKALEGAPTERSQAGLRDDLQAEGYFLACVCTPEEDLTVDLGESALRKTTASVTAIDPLNNTVACLRVTSETSLPYIPGQFLNIRRSDGLVRSYSIASVPDLDDEIHFHVAHVPDGQMSGWIHNELTPGDSIELLGPQGACYYTPGNPEQPLLLIGTGTGLAPLYGILRHAIHARHTGPIHLYHGGLDPQGLYLVEELRALEAAHASVNYTPCVLRGEEEGVISGPIDTIVLERHTDLSGWSVFLCGDPEIVRKLQRKTFLAGARMDDIHADAFLRSPEPTPSNSKS